MTRIGSRTTHFSTHFDRRRRRGMTLVEIMIVVVIMALIATAVGVAVLPALSGAKEDIAQQNVAAIKQAAIAYILDGGSGCPTVDDLIDDRKLDEDTDPQDPWGNAYELECNRRQRRGHIGRRGHRVRDRRRHHHPTSTGLGRPPVLSS